MRTNIDEQDLFGVSRGIRDMSISEYVRIHRSILEARRLARTHEH